MIKKKFAKLYDIQFLQRNLRYLFCDKINMITTPNLTMFSKQANLTITLKKNNIIARNRIIRILAFIKNITGSNIKIRKTKIKVKNKIRNFILVFNIVIKKNFYNKFINLLKKINSLKDKFLNTMESNTTLPKKFNSKGVFCGVFSKNFNFSFLFKNFKRKFKSINTPINYYLTEYFPKLKYFSCFLMDFYKFNFNTFAKRSILVKGVSKNYRNIN